MLGRSCKAELVAFRVQHDDVAEDTLVIVFPYNSCAACNNPGRLGSDQSLPASHVPRTFTSHADVDMESVLR
jgi:hypothetical protein